MARTVAVPDKLAARLAAASAAERDAAAALDKAQRALRRELRAAQRKGYSVRALAVAAKLRPSRTHAFLTHDNGGQ